MNFAFKLKLKKISEHILVDLYYPNLAHAILSLAHLGAISALLPPSSQAVLAKQRVAILALLRILDNHGANGAQKVI